MSATIDEQFIEYIVKSLVGKPDEVKLMRTIDEKGVLLELTVDPEDLGRVIGKRGATAQSLRTLLRALGTKNDARYNLKIVDNGYPKPERSERRDDADSGSGWASEPNSGNDTVESEPAAEYTAAANDDEEDAWSTSSSSSTSAEASHEDVLSKTRKELDDLDDLDI